MNAPETPKKRQPPNRPLAKKPATVKSLGEGISTAASQRAAAILEVLAGERTPQQAAAALSVSVPYFYLLERKALRGLLQACEPQPKGPPGPSSERQLQALELQLARCQRECQRQAALVRATQRAVGLPPSPSAEPAKTSAANGKRRRRRPAARALRTAKILRHNSSVAEQAASSTMAAINESLTISSTPAQETDHVTRG